MPGAAGVRGIRSTCKRYLDNSPPEQFPSSHFTIDEQLHINRGCFFSYCNVCLLRTLRLSEIDHITFVETQNITSADIAIYHVNILNKIYEYNLKQIN